MRVHVWRAQWSSYFATLRRSKAGRSPQGRPGALVATNAFELPGEINRTCEALSLVLDVTATGQSSSQAGCVVRDPPQFELNLVGSHARTAVGQIDSFRSADCVIRRAIEPSNFLSQNPCTIDFAQYDCTCL